MTWEDLKSFTNASVQDEAYVQDCWNTAVALVSNWAGSAALVIPDAVLQRAYLMCGSELFHAKKAPNGIAQWAGIDGAQPIRIARDPMTPVYSLLSQWVVRL